MALLERREVARFVVRSPVLPATKEDADPLERERADGGVVGGALGLVALVERPGRARMFGLSRRRRGSFSGCRRKSSRAMAASVGSSFARLGVKARRYLARVLGLTGKMTKTSCSRRAETMGPVRQLEADGDGTAAEALAQALCPGVDDGGSMLDDGELEVVGAGDLEANVVLAVGPVDADEGGELVLGSGRDMQSRAQRRQYGEPVRRLSLSVRYGQRHARGLEAELVSVSRSALQIRSPRVHVPLRSSRVASSCPKWNSPPIKPLKTDGRFAPAAERRYRWTDKRCALSMA